MSDPILLGEYDGIPYFEKIIRSMRVYESLDNPEVQEEYLLLLINLVKLWHISDPRYGKSFLELFPLHVLKKILNDARYSKKIQFPPELAQYNARSESHHSLKEIALELLYLAFSDPSNYERLHEWHLIDVLTENLSCTTRSSALMYLEHVANSDVYMYELLNPRLVRRLAQLSLGSPVIELDTRRTYLYLLLKMLDIVTLCDNTPTDSEGVHITPEQLLYTLEPALDVYIGDLEKCVVMSIDKLLILLPIVHTFDVIGRKTKLLKDVFGLIYFDRIRYAVKRIYSNKIEIANKRADLLDKYQELLDTRQLKNISGVHMILILVNIATSWVNGNWLATETNIKVRREPVNISNVQLIGLLVSSSAIEIELYVNDMEQLGGRSESYEYKERILTASLNIARRALTYLDDKITENYENTQGTTDQPELSCNSVGRFPVEYGNIISKLHTIFTILHSFLTKHWGVIGMTFDDISATIVRDMFMFACKWIVLAMDNGHKKYAEELIQLILVMCEKNDPNFEESPILSYAWFIVEISQSSMISKILVAEYNILGRLSNIWMNGLQSTESQLEYMITIILYRISLEYDWFARGVSDVQYAKVLDRLIFLMDHCDSMEILEKRSHYEGSLAVIGALIISRTNARYSPHIDTFIDKYIKALYEGFGLTEYKLVTNIPNAILKISNMRIPSPFDFSRYRTISYEIDRICADQISSVKAEGVHDLKDFSIIIDKMRG